MTAHNLVAACICAALAIAGCQRDPDKLTVQSPVMSNPEAFQSELFDSAVREGTASFAALVDKYSNERFYAFTFYTNNDLRGVYPFANTVEGLERIGFEMNSEEQWIAGEWNLEFDDAEDQMAETTRLLLGASDAFTDDTAAATTAYGAYNEFRQDTFRTLSRALLAIRESGVFRDHATHDRIAFWVHVGDPDGDASELMFRSVVEHLAPSDVEQLREIYEFD